MMTIHELLEDKTYKEFFTTRPQIPQVHPDQIPWRVYVQREANGGWAKKEFALYTAAFKFLKPYLKTCHDAAIQSKGVAYQPPARTVRITKNGKPVMVDGKPKLRRIVWQPKLPYDEVPHTWCTYCRRPTVFAWFSKHHAFPKGYELVTPYQRCVICGTSERLVLNYA